MTMQAAAAMDRIYRRQRHFYDLTRRYYLLGRNEAIRALSPSPGQTVLEVGCGTGRNCIEIARHYPQARVSGFDISNAMLATAADSIARAGLADRISIAQGDATAFDLSRLFPGGGAPADRILISYVLSMIPDWPAVLDSSIRALAPGGRLVIVDFGPGDGLPGWFMRGLDSWLGRFSVTRRLSLPERLADVAARHGLDLAMSRPWRGYAILAVLKRP